MFVSPEKKRRKAEQSVLPQGCVGRVGTQIEITNPKSSFYYRTYRIKTNLGCSGLLDGLVDIGETEYPFGEGTHKGQAKKERAAITSAASQIMEACASCASSPAGRRRIEARLQISEVDDLQTRLAIAQAEQATAEAVRDAEQLRKSDGSS